MNRNDLIILFLLVFIPLQLFADKPNNKTEEGNKTVVNETSQINYEEERDEVVFFEHFDHGGEPPPGWTQEIISGSELWLFMQGNGSGQPSNSHSGATNACLYHYWGSGGYETRLISPPIDFGNFTSQPDLTFWIYQEQWSINQDYTSIQYRTSENDSWHEIGFVTNNYDWWHKIDNLPYLPNPSSTYQISFVGDLNGGYGICIDDVQITGVDNGVPGTPSDPEPDHQSTGISVNTDLGWTNGGNTDSVRVYFDTIDPPLNCIYEGAAIDTLLNDILGGNLENLTTYYWQISAIKYPHTKNSAVWNFTTQYPACSGFPIIEDFNDGFENFKNPILGNDTDWIMHDTLFVSADSAAWNNYEDNDTNILIQTCTMDLTARINTYLKFQHIAKTEADHDSCLVEISTDAGYNWQPLSASDYMGISAEYFTNECFWETAYPEWGTENQTPDNSMWREEIFDLSAYNFSEAAVIRFRIQVNSSIQKFGWLIDDIQITELIGYPTCDLSDLSFENVLDTTSTYNEILQVSNSGDIDLIYSANVNYVADRSAFFEDFEGSFPPSGWNEYILGSAGSGWQQTTYWSHSPSHSAYHNDDNVSSISEDWLVTPAISTSIGDSLYFWEKNKYVDGYYYYHGVWLSDGSPNPAEGDFIELAEYSNVASSWKQRKIDLSSYALQDVYIAFKYMGNYDTEWYIDDVGIIPGMAQWLTIDGSNFTEDLILPGDTDEITIGYDATDLDIGFYSAEIIFNHNAPDSPEAVNVSLTVVEQILNRPENVCITVENDGANINITWDAVAGATSYKVYSSDDPETGFTEDTSGTFTDESWTASIPNGKKFYYVKAVN